MPRHLFQPDPNARFRQVAELYNAGKSYSEIADQLNLTARQVQSSMLHARRAGLCPPVKRQYSWAYQEWKIYNRNLRLGKIRDVYLGLTEEEREWLLSQVPEGATIAEFLVALVRDAKAEEVA